MGIPSCHNTALLADQSLLQHLILRRNIGIFQLQNALFNSTLLQLHTHGCPHIGSTARFQQKSIPLIATLNLQIGKGALHIPLQQPFLHTPYT